MSASRDDFIIAIRSAFLKKSIQQKFSLLTLVIISIVIITLSSLNFKIIKNIKSGINEIVYRSSFVISVPENFIKSSYTGIKQYSNFYDDYKNNELELKKLKSQNVSSRIVKSENEELKELIEDYTATKDKILAKVIVDHQSPFLKTVIINKGSADKIKIGTNIYDRSYLVGRVIETNYKSSRVLLLSDLNSSVSVSITPGNIQAIIRGDGKNSGEIKYIKDNLIEGIEDKSIVYTSGTGSIFKSGIPVGKLSVLGKNLLVDFYSDFTQLKYVFAEVELKNKIRSDESLKSGNKSRSLSNTEKIKLKILNEENRILNETNKKFIEENQFLKFEINEYDNKISTLQNKLKAQEEKNTKNNIDQEELEFLRLNLTYSSKCKKTAFRKGYKVGTPEYKKCILRKGKKLND